MVPLDGDAHGWLEVAADSNADVGVDLGSVESFQETAGHRHIVVEERRQEAAFPPPVGLCDTEWRFARRMRTPGSPLGIGCSSFFIVLCMRLKYARYRIQIESGPLASDHPFSLTLKFPS